MMQNNSDMSAMQLTVQEQSPGLGFAFVYAHLALHFAFARNASTSSLVSMIWHLATQELVQSLMGGPPLVILHCLSVWAFAFENPRMCNSDKNRNMMLEMIEINRLRLCQFLFYSLVFSGKSLRICVQDSDNMFIEEVSANFCLNPFTCFHIWRHNQSRPFCERFSTSGGFNHIALFQLCKCMNNPGTAWGWLHHVDRYKWIGLNK